jgi:hypothetical protein
VPWLHHKLQCVQLLPVAVCAPAGTVNAAVVHAAVHRVHVCWWLVQGGWQQHAPGPACKVCCWEGTTGWATGGDAGQSCCRHSSCYSPAVEDIIMWYR